MLGAGIEEEDVDVDLSGTGRILVMDDDRGILDVMSKPYRIEDLIRKIKRQMKKPGGFFPFRVQAALRGRSCRAG